MAEEGIPGVVKPNYPPPYEPAPPPQVTKMYYKSYDINNLMIDAS